MAANFLRKHLVRELAVLLVLKVTLIFAIRALFFAEPVISSHSTEADAIEQMSRHWGISLSAVPATADQNGNTVSSSTFSNSTASQPEALHDQ